MQKQGSPKNSLGLKDAQTGHNPLRVLVVEDDQELSTVMDRILKSIDETISLEWATSAEDAIVLLKKMAETTPQAGKSYDLVVVDIFLDGKRTGIDLWHTCQKLLPNVPVLVTSALSLDKFFAAVGSDSITPPYLQKPFSPRECKQAFEGILKLPPHQKKSHPDQEEWLS